jgi:hypothetical protein
MYDHKFLASVDDGTLKKFVLDAVSISKADNVMFDIQPQKMEDLEKERKIRNISMSNRRLPLESIQ